MDDFSSLSPLDGGWSGETFLAEASGSRSVVRIFADPRHHPQAPQIQEALLRLVRGLIPVPQVLEVRRADPEAGTPGLLVTEFVDGVRGDLLLPDLDAQGRHRVGCALGAIARTLSRIPMLRAGTFADADLRITPYDLWLPDWVDEYSDRLELSQDELTGLREVARAAAERLAARPRACLVHSDLNPKNVLLDPTTLAVLAVVDWEFAHAGHSFTDLGNLVRFDRDAQYLAGILTGWSAARPGERGGDGEDLDIAHAADLPALVELASRAGQNPVADRALRRLRTIAAQGDVAATEHS
ncbi:phosphotransferase family protein [Nocardioides insulae]|uniref:phosphotransferase family protein n=1 Tax=Nocardioides insulae TaxID=394734 RepID=UPI000414CDC1|nr:phosphotransferase [Nocardioides insulae]